MCGAPPNKSKAIAWSWQLMQDSSRFQLATRNDLLRLGQRFQACRNNCLFQCYLIGGVVGIFRLFHSKPRIDGVHEKLP